MGRLPEREGRLGAPALKHKCPETPGMKLRKLRNLRLALAPQAHDHVDACNFIAFRRCRGLADDNVGIRNIEHLILTFDEEVMMGGDVGVEIGLRAVNRDLSQESY